MIPNAYNAHKLERNQSRHHEPSSLITLSNSRSRPSNEAKNAQYLKTLAYINLPSRSLFPQRRALSKLSRHRNLGSISTLMNICRIHVWFSRLLHKQTNFTNLFKYTHRPPVQKYARIWLQLSTSNFSTNSTKHILYVRNYRKRP